MKIIRCDHGQDLCPAFLTILSSIIEPGVKTTVALPTGRTYEPLYKAMVEAGEPSMADVHGFGLDEFWVDGGVKPFRDYFMKKLVEPTDFDPFNLTTFDTAAPDIEAECARYESAIKEAGGLDLVLLGVGADGHIAFNEPGSPFSSRCRPVPLAEETRRYNAKVCGVPYESVRGALTMGIATIMEARHIVLAATGAEKADAIRAALNGPATEDIPASILKAHSDLTVLLDSAAAAKLS